MFDSMKLDGYVLSFPLATNNAAVFYRPSLFEQAGVTQTPKTWDELKEVAKILTQDTNNDQRIDQHSIFLYIS